LFHKLILTIIFTTRLSAQIIQDSTNLINSRVLDTTSQTAVVYFYEPYPQQVGSAILQLGGSLTLLPAPVVEDEYPTPALDLQYKRGMFKNISLVGSLSTNYFTNLLHIGIQLNLAKNDFSFGVENHLGGFAGFISIEGQFDNNSAYAIFYMPILRMGYRFANFSVSMSWAASYIFKSVNKVSSLKTKGPENNWNDLFCTLAIEQPFLKSSLISIGLSLTYSRTPYQSWLLFNTIDEWLFVPEFFFGFQL